MFRKADGCDSGTCVEVNRDVQGQVLIRDSKDQDGPILIFTNEEWITFIGGVKNGEFDV